MQHKMRIKTEEIHPKYHEIMNVTDDWTIINISYETGSRYYVNNIGTVNVFDLNFYSSKCDIEVELIGEEA